ncbi:uncharacterized protein LOC128724469 [Anopheles nili]|uniref:uncharacterized protein LOC128724469 n=1 Tax=Anopheles nili TaxID=185578 RepID=UPI00237A73F8|nr:uncharacterized protein LOC128724469 [Anopheles nili]
MDDFQNQPNQSSEMTTMLPVISIKVNPISEEEIEADRDTEAIIEFVKVDCRTNDGREIDQYVDDIEDEDDTHLYQNSIYDDSGIKTVTRDDSKENSRNQVEFLDEFRPIGMKSNERSVYMTNVQTSQFISAVREHQCLWNPKSKAFKNKQIRDHAWREISKLNGLEVKKLKYKWASLRGSFRHYMSLARASKTMNMDERYNIQWPFYEKMSFVKGDGDFAKKKSSIFPAKPTVSSNSYDQQTAQTTNQHEAAAKKLTAGTIDSPRILKITREPPFASVPPKPTPAAHVPIKKQKWDETSSDQYYDKIKTFVDTSKRLSDMKVDHDVMYLAGLYEKLLKFSPRTKQIIKCKIDQLVNDQILKSLEN